MSFGEGDLHEQVDRLKDVNGELCAEINRQERVIERMDAENTELRMIAGAAKIRVGLLESLVRDWAMAPCAVCDPWDEHFACEHFDGHDCTLGIRMAELGIEAR